MFYQLSQLVSWYMSSRAGRTWFLGAVWEKLLDLQCPLFLRIVWEKMFFKPIFPRLKSRNLTFCSRIPTQGVKSRSMIVANHHFLVVSEEGGHSTPRLGPWNFVKETFKPNNFLIPSFLCIFTDFIDINVWALETLSKRLPNQITY
jgi:hypothetical protein